MKHSFFYIRPSFLSIDFPKWHLPVHGALAVGFQKWHPAASVCHRPAHVPIVLRLRPFQLAPVARSQGQRITDWRPTAQSHPGSRDMALYECRNRSALDAALRLIEFPKRHLPPLCIFPCPRYRESLKNQGSKWLRKISLGDLPENPVEKLFSTMVPRFSHVVIRVASHNRKEAAGENC
jgi:hypothetical protein